MFKSAQPLLRASARAYSTVRPAAKESNLAPILLGLGLVGSAGFFYSTSGQRNLQTESLVEKVKNAVTVSALSPDEFRAFKLAKVEPYNHNTSRFIFELPEGSNSGLVITSALVTKSATEGLALAKNGKPAIRPYTPVTAPNTQGTLELLVKNYAGGVMSSHIHELKVGESLQMKGPILKFPYVANEFKEIALIAGGSGITPMLQLLQAIDTNPADKTKATLIFGNVTEADILLRKEFEDLAARKPDQFKNVFVLDKPPPNWSGKSGFIGRDILVKELPQPAWGDQIKIFVCGPPAQVESISGNKISNQDQGAVKGVLADLGYTASQIYKF